ncbi:hypothetical protein pb186bvf_020543 [Paramecium bursaria]
MILSITQVTPKIFRFCFKLNESDVNNSDLVQQYFYNIMIKIINQVYLLYSISKTINDKISQIIIFYSLKKYMHFDQEINKNTVI